MSELKDQLNKLSVRVDELANNPSELTKDALLAEVRAFYDVAKNTELKAATKAAPKAAKVEETKAPVVPEQPVPAKEPIKEVEPPLESVTRIETPVVEKPAEPVAEKETKPVTKKEEEPVAEAPKVEEKPKAKKEPLIGKDEPQTKDKDKKILAGQFNKAPLTDLRSAIPLNEKFGIIRNLFKGNASDFGDAVLKLNNAANAKELNHYFNLLAQRFEWDERTEEYQNFAGYVERKTMSLEPSNANPDQ